MLSQLLTAQNVIVQGITGAHGSFHTRTMLDYGTRIIGGTSPSRVGEHVHGVPTYKTIQDIQKDTHIDISVVFVPAAHAKGALLEAINANIPLIICITEGIPIHDMLVVMARAKDTGTVIIGPNCPGVLMPGGNKLGIIPPFVGLPGHVGIVSRSGTLTYEAAAALTERGIGQKYIVGIGGDPVHGVDFIACLDMFQQDSEVDSIVMIGEIGGSGEQKAAEHIPGHITKPVYAYIAGHSAPIGVQLGHAGAILGSDAESAAAKTKLLAQAGAHVADSLHELIRLVH